MENITTEPVEQTKTKGIKINDLGLNRTESVEQTKLREQIEKDNKIFEMKINCFRTIRNDLDEMYEELSDELHDEENTLSAEYKRISRMLLTCYSEVDLFITKEIKQLKTFIK